MSTQSNIVAFDGASTPVTHTLVPVSVAVDPKTSEIVALWREMLTTVPAYAAITAEARYRRLPSGVIQCVLTTAVPVMESVSGQNSAGYTAAPKVAYTNTVRVTGFFHERATPGERRLARQLATNIFGSVTTSVTPVTTGPAPEMFDLGVTPG